MGSEFEYYIVDRANDNSHPLLTGASGSPAYQLRKKYVEDPDMITFRIAAPIPRKPKFVDYHSTPYSVVSDRIYKVMKRFDIKGVQFIPATLLGKDDELYEDYWFLNIFNLLPAMDKDKSEYDGEEDEEEVDSIDKLVLNEDFLKTMPLEDRLVFRLAEDYMIEIYHKTVVDSIMAINPEGISCTNVKDWNSSVPFD